MPSVVHAACPHDCPDACAVLITVEGGRAVRIQGDPRHPVTRGFLCAKVARYLDRVYSPDRVLYPARRIGPKGSGQGSWLRITWDEALTEITASFRRISADFGPEAILPYSYGGTLGVLNNASMDRRFFHRLGASQLERTICASTGGEALLSVVGRKMGTEPEQFAASRYIIAWGANIHGNNVHLWPFIEEARRQGAKLVVIDPYRTRTAKCADWYLPIVPGTDAALALGMMHVIIGNRLHDESYIARHTSGFEELRERVRDYTPERVASWTGIAAHDVIRLATEYATQRPAVIRVNYGVQRSDRGGMAVRAIALLPCITGSWMEIGGGLQLSLSGAFKLNREALEMPQLMLASPLGRPARVVNMSQLGSALHDLDNPPLKSLFVYNSNPAAIAPHHNRVVSGLLRPGLFTVVHEQFFTDTTDYADIVLPATTFFEHKELQTAYGHHYVQVSDQAIAPVGEAKSNVELFRELALKMGFAEPCFRESVDEMIDLALSAPDSALDGIDRLRLEKEHWVRLKLPPASPAAAPSSGGASAAFRPFAAGFPTPSGKALLYNQALIPLGLDPVASFTPPEESRHSPAANRYPLEMLARKADNFLNSTFCNIESLQPLEDTGALEISAADAAARGIHHGDRVRVWNGRGELELNAYVNGAVQPGVVAAKLGWGRFAKSRVTLNALTSERLADMGGGPTFYSCLVEVEKLRE
ncbi:MAG: molybdopterin-dependent oxidoreductase [Acidobacteria bacterium]|nr:molybdopterin-dependent oxidoreductase [Acidobacteriota bacterium]